VVVLSDRSFNAFVMDGRHIFINAGVLFDAKTPNEVIGVFAHETGHLAGGHLQRLREQLASAQTASIIALLAGIGAAVAGSRSGAAGDIGAAAILAPQQAIMRTVLSYVRTQEDQADHAGVKFLNATGQSPRGMVDLFKRLSSESLFNSRYIDPYMQTHPMPAERVAALETVAKASPYWDRKDSPELQLRHDMMRAKLSGFLERPDTIARRYPTTDHSLPARYARAISTYRNSDLRQAIAQIDSLIQAQPNNPYFYELKGQALRCGTPSNCRITMPWLRSCWHRRSMPPAMRNFLKKPSPCFAPQLCASQRPPTPIRSSPWLTDARVIWPMPTWLLRRPPSPGATSRPHVNWPPAPRLVFRSALPHGYGPTTSSTSSRPMPKPASNSHKDKKS
jgi:hypothetical protein